MTTPLVTILMIHLGGYTYSIDMPSQMECGAALVVVAAAEDDAVVRCVRTYAPSASPRPVARGGS
jgi:hypothetical protein